MELRPPDPPLHDAEIALRQWSEDDVADLAEACRDPEIPRWIPFVPSPYAEEDAREFVAGATDRWEAAAGASFAIVDASTGKLLGSIGMGLRPMGTGHIGYWVAREARGRGVATRALRLLARWAFEELGLGRVELVTDPANRASQRVAEKACFRREAVLRSALQYPDGRRADSVMFSLLPDELD
jgi:RimJ/RimL family protein N-acetyltransferase